MAKYTVTQTVTWEVDLDPQEVPSLRKDWADGGSNIVDILHDKGNPVTENFSYSRNQK